MSGNLDYCKITGDLHSYNILVNEKYAQLDDLK